MSTHMCAHRHDNKGLLAGWFLGDIVVDNPAENLRWYFVVDRWLDKDRDDGACARSRTRACVRT